MLTTAPPAPKRVRRLATGVLVTGAVAASLLLGAPAATALPASGASSAPAAKAKGDNNGKDGNNGKDKGRGDGKGVIGDPSKLTFGVQPAGPKAVDPRPSLNYKGVRPGQTLYDHVGIINLSEQPITLSFYAADAFISSDGGFDALTAGRRSKDLGSWVRLRRDQVTVPARSTFITPIELDVPRSAEPGDHAAAIIASLRTYTKDEKGNIVAQEARTGTRLYVRIEGRLTPRLELRRQSVSYDGGLLHGKANVTYTLENTGNVRLVGTQSLRVSGLFGLGTDARDLPDLPEMLPGSRVTFTVPVNGVVGTIFNSARLTVDPRSVAGNVDPALAQVSATSTFTGWSFAVLGLVVAVFAFTFYSVVLWRRRGSSSGPGWGDGGPPPSIGPGGSGGPAELPSPPDRRPVRTMRVAGPVVALLAALCALVPAASPAAAADGTLTFIPGHGTASTPLYAATSGPCPKQAKAIVGSMYGSGLPRDGAVVMSLQEAPLRTDSAFGFGLRDNLQSIAAEVGATLKGPYKLVIKCVDSLNLTTYSQFVGTVNFPTSAAFDAPTPSKPVPGIPPGYLALVFPEFKKVVAQDNAAAQADNQAALAEKSSTTSPKPHPSVAPGTALAGAAGASKPTSRHVPLGGLGWSPLQVVFGLALVAGVLWLWTRMPASDAPSGPRQLAWPDRDRPKSPGPSSGPRR